MNTQNETVTNALRETEELYQALLENSCEGIILLDSECKVLYVSPAEERILGRRPAESIGSIGFSWVHPDDMEASKRIFEEGLRNPGQTFRIEVRALHKNGSWRWVECSSRNMLHDASVRGIVLNYHDITERRSQEEEATRQRDRFEIITRATQDVVWDWDIETDGLWWNSEFYTRFGYPRDIPPTCSFWASLIHPDDSARIMASLKEVFDGAETHWSGEYRLKHADGSMSEVLDRGFVIRDKSGKATRMLGTVMDISERKSAEVKMEKLAAFVRYNPNPAFEFSAEAKLTYWNEAGVQLASSIGHENPASILPSNITELVNNCLQTGKPKDLISIVRERSIVWSLVPVTNCNVVHCYASDITNRTKLEEQLRQVSKMEAIGQLAGGVAHDFNNLLTVIEGHAALLSMTDELKKETSQDSLQEITLAAERAANLTRQLLTFSRKQMMQSRDLNCNEVVSNITRMLQRLLGEDIQLQVTYAPILPLVHGDPGMLEQILVNLAVNGRDAMPKGGRLTIETSVQIITTEHLASNPEATKGQAIRIAVTDSGCGIQDEDLSRIFEPFFTTKEVGKGTGLGLATVYGIVKQHKGWIKVRSTVGKGTTFEIFLPSCNAKTPSPKRDLKPKPRGGVETILLVEDEIPVRQLTKIVLERYGYKVIEAPTGKEAWNLWQQHRNSIDLVLTDMVMPDGMSGRDLVSKIQNENSQAKAIFVSGYSPDCCGSDTGFNEGINFLQKPYHPDELSRAIRACLDKNGCDHTGN